jgi:hypothetical protein
MVQRYDPETFRGEFEGMVRRDKGHWVGYTDCAALEAKCAKLEAFRQSVWDIIGDIEGDKDGRIEKLLLDGETREDALREG